MAAAAAKDRQRGWELGAAADRTRPVQRSTAKGGQSTRHVAWCCSIGCVGDERMSGSASFRGVPRRRSGGGHDRRERVSVDRRNELGRIGPWTAGRGGAWAGPIAGEQPSVSQTQTVLSTAHRLSDSAPVLSSWVQRLRASRRLSNLRALSDSLCCPPPASLRSLPSPYLTSCLTAPLLHSNDGQRPGALISFCTCADWLAATPPLTDDDRAVGLARSPELEDSCRVLNCHSPSPCRSPPPLSRLLRSPQLLRPPLPPLAASLTPMAVWSGRRRRPSRRPSPRRKGRR